MKKTDNTVRTLLYSGDLLAVDLGSFAIKILHLKANVRSLTVHGSARREVWRALAEAKTDEEKLEVYAAALRELLAETGLKVRNASIALSGSGVVVRFATLPPGQSYDRDAPLPADIQATIPFEKSDADVAGLVVPGPASRKPPREDLILVAAEKKAVSGAMDVVRKAGLRPAVITNDVMALAGAHVFFSAGKAAETVVLVDAGASSTSVTVVDAGVPRASRVFNIAGNAFTRAIKREFAVEFDEAERLKLEHGLESPMGKTTSEDAAAAKVARALKPAVKDLAAEILRTIEIFLSRTPDARSVSRVVLAGGSARMKGLPESLSAEVGLEVELFRPMVNVAAKNGTLGIAPLDVDLAVSCGLALSNVLLRRAEGWRINLVPKRIRRSAIIRDVSPGFWRWIAAPAFVVLALSVYGVWAVRVAHREAALEAKIEEAARKDAAMHKKIDKKKGPAAGKKAPEPFAFLGRLAVSGVFGSGRSAMVMLDGGGAAYTARGGKLYDSSDAEVRGVNSQISGNALSLEAGGKRYSLAIPR